MKGFTERVKTRMEELHMDQKTLSERSGIPAASLCRYLNGKQPRIDIVLNIARALGVEISYLVGNDDDRASPYEEAVAVIGRTKDALTPEEKRRIIEEILK